MINLTKWFVKPRHLYIYNHLGLGDHIIVNSLIREIVKGQSSRTFTLFVKFRNFESVKFMFSDLDNFTYCVVNNDDEVLKILSGIHKSKVIKIGFDNVTNDFDKCFYRNFNVPFSKRFNSNLIRRDFNSEKALFDLLNLQGKEYVFVHDDSTRDLVIDDSLIKGSNFLIIRPFITNTIFDWCKVLENAAEIHCICSSFKALVDSMQLTKPKLFYHHNLNSLKGPRNDTFTSSNLEWTII